MATERGDDRFTTQTNDKRQESGFRNAEPRFAETGCVAFHVSGVHGRGTRGRQRWRVKVTDQRKRQLAIPLSIAGSPRTTALRLQVRSG